MDVIKRNYLVCVFFIIVLFFLDIQLLYADTPDFTGHWAQDTMDSWLSKQLLVGYEDEKVKPDENITRAEFFTLINRLFRFEERKEMTFIDVKTSDWFIKEIQKAVTAGYLKGYEDGTIRPTQEISRQEAALILYRVFQFSVISTEKNIPFKDKTAIADWSEQAVLFLSQKEYIQGYPDKTFRPECSITRAEAITMIQSIAGTLYSESGRYEIATEGNVIINQPRVTLENSMIKGNLYITEGAGDLLLDGVIVLGDIFIQGEREKGIVFYNSRLNNIDIQKQGKEVQILVSGDTRIDKVKLLSGVKLEITKSAFVKEIIIHTSQPIDIKGNGKINKIQLEVEETNLEIEEGMVSWVIDLYNHSNQKQKDVEQKNQMEGKPNDDEEKDIEGNQISDAEAVAKTKEALTLENTDAVIKDLILPTKGDFGTIISWDSSNKAVVKSDGTIIRPSYETGDRVVFLTATIQKGSAIDTKIFEIVVKKLEPGAITIESIVFNKEKNIVTIKGIVSEGMDQEITLKVIEPDGSLNMLDQTTAKKVDGMYSFQYNLKEEKLGEYKVFIGGTKIESPVRGSFIVEAESSKEPKVVVTKAEYNQNTREVSIAGSISTGEDQEVTLKVFDSKGELNYINQQTSKKEGKYEFVYEVEEDALQGIYEVLVGGERILLKNQGKTTFEVVSK